MRFRRLLTLALAGVAVVASAPTAAAEDGVDYCYVQGVGGQCTAITTPGTYILWGEAATSWGVTLTITCNGLQLAYVNARPYGDTDFFNAGGYCVVQLHGDGRGGVYLYSRP